MKKVLQVLTLVILLNGVYSFAYYESSACRYSLSQEGDWENLGMRKVNMAADRDEIVLKASDGFYTKLKLKVLDAPILLRNVKVVFGNGEFKNVRFNKKIPAGTESRAIDFPGNKRIIKKVILNYTTVAKHKGKATVIVLGKH